MFGRKTNVEQGKQGFQPTDKTKAAGKTAPTASDISGTTTVESSSSPVPDYAAMTSFVSVASKRETERIARDAILDAFAQGSTTVGIALLEEEKTRARKEWAASLREGEEVDPAFHVYYLSFADVDFPEGADLSGVDFSECDLARADFSKVHSLWRTKFNRSNLVGANFSGKVLDEADFRETVLGGADFSGCRLTNTNFSYAVGSGVNFSHLTGNSLHTDFSGAELSDADFRGSKITYASFNNTFLRNADFREANLEGSVLQGAYLQRAMIHPDTVAQTNGTLNWGD